MKNKDKIIEEILYDFDFEKVHKVMESLKWKYVSSKTISGIPSIAELVLMARGLLEEVIDSEYNMVGTGGFYAYKRQEEDDMVYGLKFVLEEAETIGEEDE